jgi:hypothetical protein
MVMVLAAAISAAPGSVLFSDIFIKSFSELVMCWRGASANGSADREAARAAGGANSKTAAAVSTANLRMLPQDRVIGARVFVEVVIRHSPLRTGIQ